jgi:hypothetical protein
LLGFEETELKKAYFTRVAGDDVNPFVSAR